jgi:hypothetical protein
MVVIGVYYLDFGLGLQTAAKVLDSCHNKYRGDDKSLVRPGRKQATETGDFDVHVTHL